MFASVLAKGEAMRRQGTWVRIVLAAIAAVVLIVVVAPEANGRGERRSRVVGRR